MNGRAVTYCRSTPISVEPDLRSIEGTEADDELAMLANAIGHPARVQILQ
jgi:ArsR family transcriptional regulator, arsenate/arsenite/antimonite-responsive transcriptional repressor